LCTVLEVVEEVWHEEAAASWRHADNMQLCQTISTVVLLRRKMCSISTKLQYNTSISSVLAYLVIKLLFLTLIDALLLIRRFVHRLEGVHCFPESPKPVPTCILI
jgi:hypothetical protein